MLLGAIADDFTGATDLCSMLVRGGMRTVQVIGTNFSISGLVFLRRYDLSGQINGNYVKVTGDWDGNYLSAEGEVNNGTAQLDFRTTGVVYSAFITLAVH